MSMTFSLLGEGLTKAALGIGLGNDIHRHPMEHLHYSVEIEKCISRSETSLFVLIILCNNRAVTIECPVSTSGRCQQMVGW